MWNQNVTVDLALAGSFDVDEAVATVPASYRVKGMFFSRHVQRLGDEFSSLLPYLVEPPDGGRFMTFRDYPQRDYVRVYAAVAQKLHPRLGLNESARRIAREDFDAFAESIFGRVVVALAGDARAALHRLPSVYERVAPGAWQVSTEDIDDRTVRVRFEGLYGPWCYSVGQLEGIVMAFDSTPRIGVVGNDSGRVHFDVRID